MLILNELFRCDLVFFVVRPIFSSGIAYMLDAFYVKKMETFVGVNIFVGHKCRSHFPGLV